MSRPGGRRLKSRLGAAAAKPPCGGWVLGPVPARAGGFRGEHGEPLAPVSTGGHPAARRRAPPLAVRSCPAQAVLTSRFLPAGLDIGSSADILAPHPAPSSQPERRAASLQPQPGSEYRNHGEVVTGADDAIRPARLA